MQNDRQFYVYIHRRKTDGSIFYVGKGKGNRCNVSFGRSDWWSRVAKKHGWYVEIVKDGLSNKEAMDLEKSEIARIPNLVNLTSGGEGFEIHPAAKEKMRQAKLGRKQSPEHAQKSRTSKVGKKQPKSAVEGLRLRKSKPIINSDGEIFPSATEAARQFSTRLGKYVSQANISMSAQFNRNNAYGLTWSYDTSRVPGFRPTNYREKRVLCVETGGVFRSVQAAKHWVSEWRGKANNQCISAAARNGSKAYGYHWEYQPADDEELPEFAIEATEKLRRYAA